ncbi:hypothetical protein Tco_0100104, partial [Tanacetum coccineum]
MEPIDTVLGLRVRLLESGQSRILLVESEEELASPQETLQENLKRLGTERCRYKTPIGASVEQARCIAVVKRNVPVMTLEFGFPDAFLFFSVFPTAYTQP